VGFVNYTALDVELRKYHPHRAIPIDAL
jgi:hypothetical protein